MDFPSNRDLCLSPQRHIWGRIKPGKGAAVVYPESGIPAPGAPGSSQIPAPKSAAKCLTTKDRGGLDSSHGNWYGLETREVFPECSLCIRTFTCPPERGCEVPE